jgi:hypothetical protein
LWAPYCTKTLKKRKKKMKKKKKMLKMKEDCLFVGLCVCCMSDFGITELEVKVLATLNCIKMGEKNIKTMKMSLLVWPPLPTTTTTTIIT